jgi:lipoprotein-releasing system permease protein
MYEADANSAYTSLQHSQRFMGFAQDDDVSGIGVQIADPDRADAVAREIESRLGLSYAAQSWTVRNRSLFSALRLEKLAMFVILLLIVIVAAFNIVSTLVMVVADRRREIGILKSMGMTDGTILRVFMFQGAWIGVVGTMIGTALGLAACWVIESTELIRIPPEVYFVDRLPVHLRPLDITAIVAASILVALAATIYPSLQAAKMEPVEAIRSE